MLDRRKWDFIQIQLNYYDWLFGTAREQYEILRERSVPVMVMEPVHGGMLANLPDEAGELLRAADPARSEAAWALDFVRSLPGVAVILSGMSSLDQVKDNVGTFSVERPLGEKDLELLRRVAGILHERCGVPCTGCRYCCADCPYGLDIPALPKAYNEYRADLFAAGGSVALSAWRLGRLAALPEKQQPAACVGCGSCTRHCPQGIDVPAIMAEMASLVAAQA